MAQKQLPKFQVTADPPGVYFEGLGIIKTGDELVIRDPDFDYRACLLPLNDAAKAMVERKKKRVEEETRARLTDTIDESTGKKYDADQITRIVLSEVKKVGPSGRRAQQGEGRKTLKPGDIRVLTPEPEVEASDDGDDDPLLAAAPAPKPGKTVRASDA